MARWLVTQGDRQFAAQDLSELKTLAQQGKVGPGDMVQAPGAADWLYASEVPELEGLLSDGASSNDFDDIDYKKSSGPGAAILIPILLLLVAGAGYFMYDQANKIPDHTQLELLGEGGLALTEMLVTADPAQVRGSPDGNAPVGTTVAKDAKVQLLSKRSGWYQIETESGEKGWVEANAVIPAYYFADKETRTEYDPIYNPDKYVSVKNSSWMQLPNQRRDNITVFSFQLANDANFDMADIKLLATIKDGKDKVLEEVEIPIEGVVPARTDTMVGTLQPDRKDKEGLPRLMTNVTFAKMAEEDESLQLRWADGVEVKMESEGFSEANIDLLEVRAVPKPVE